MVLNATFNNISATPWRSVLLMKETGIPRQNHQPVTDKLYHMSGIRTHMNIWSTTRGSDVYLILSTYDITNDGLVVWCLTPLSTIFQLYRGDITKEIKIVHIAIF